MSIFLWIAGGFIALIVLGTIFGWGSDTVFTNPRSLSDAQLERTIRLTQRMMDNSPIGSDRWRKAGDKFSAALKEQMRRRGTPLSERISIPATPSPTAGERELDWPEVEDDGGEFDVVEEMPAEAWRSPLAKLKARDS